MGRLTICMLVTATFLAGCDNVFYRPTYPTARTLTDEQISELQAEVLAVGNQCAGQRLSGRLRGFVASVQCSNPKILAAYFKVDYPDMALLNLALAKRLQLAERVDEKKITEGDMLVEFFSDVRGLPAMCTP